MPVSLSRRIRRIGILPSTYREVVTTHKSKDPLTKEVVTKEVKHKVRNPLTYDASVNKEAIAATLRAEAKVRRNAAFKK